MCKTLLWMDLCYICPLTTEVSVPTIWVSCRQRNASSSVLITLCVWIGTAQLIDIFRGSPALELIARNRRLYQRLANGEIYLYISSQSNALRLLLFHAYVSPRRLDQNRL